MIKHDCRSTYVVCLLDSPESNVFLSTRYESIVINWTKFETQNVKLSSLFCSDFWFFTTCDLWNVPNDDHFLVMGIFSNTCQESAIRGESDTLEACDRHRYHWKTSRSVVVPNSNDWVLTLLRRRDQSALLRDVEAADRRWVTEEEPLLNVVFNVHYNNGASRSEHNNIFTCDLGPLNV